MSILDHLSNIFGTAFTELGLDPQFGEVVYSNRPELGQFQASGALAAAKKSDQNPRELAEKIISSLDGRPGFSKLSIAGPGFINISLSDDFLISFLQKIQYKPQEKPQEKIIIDFGGPNVAKPLHVGHIRSSIIGDSLRRIHTFLGYDITSDIHLGDWGTQMGMLITEIKRLQPDLPYFDLEFTGPYPSESPVSVADLEKLYPQASARAKEDETVRAEAVQATKELQKGRAGYRALWQHFVKISIVSIKKDMDWLGVHFDLWNGESHYQDRIPKMINHLKEDGFAKESEGAFIVLLPATETQKELTPLLLTKSDGSSLYATTDLATIEERVQDDKTDRILYVVDQRQHLHFQQVFRVARLTEIAPKNVALQFLGFGTVNGPDGKPFKTRTGGVMKLGELIALTTKKATERMKEAGVGENYPESEQLEIAKTVAKAALKFADLSNNRMSDYSFDVDRFTTFEGKTGPYLIYTGVRIKSIFHKMDIQPASADKISNPGDLERPLLLELTKLPGAITLTATNYTPHVLAEQLFSLAQEFNRFYQNCNISKETDLIKQASWLAIITLTLEQLTLGLDLLGIDIPERM